MKFRILGPLEVVDGDTAITFDAPKLRTLLAVLLLHANEIVSSQRLIDELWGEDPPRTAPKVVQTYVSQLRKAVGRGAIVTRPPGYMLLIEDGALDAECFRRLTAEGRDLAAIGHQEQASKRFRSALGRWRGSPLADVAFESFARNEVERLEEERLGTLIERIDCELALGQHQELVAELEMLVREYPLRERLRAQLMLALYRSGSQADALEAYQQARRTLADQLGLEPSSELRELHASILRQDASLSDLAPRPEASAELPAEPTPFLGRARELAEIAALLQRADSRLLTLTGPGGTGKTRLALQAAAGSADRFPDGVWWVPLSALRDPALLTSAIAQALNIKERPDHHLEDDVVAQLTAKATLLVLDNAEHLLPDAADVVADLVSSTSATWLVTSRERLEVHAEQVFPVPTLTDRDGVDLFVSRARALDPSFELTGSVAELCGRVDNLPLALELAAASTSLFSPQQLLERLSQRLDLLKGPRDADPRQQTLRATIEWSYELLTSVEQRLFRSLSCFAGGCTYEAAEEVCGADPECLQSLLGKSLLGRLNSGPSPRYRMLETIREYAADRLEHVGEAEAVRHRHANWCCELVERRLGHVGDQGWDLTSPEDFEGLYEERDNIQAALGWAWSTGEDELALRLGSACIRFWFERGLFHDAKAWFEAAKTKLPGASAPVQLQSLKVAGLIAFFVDADAAEADRHWARALALAEQLGDPAELAWVESRRAGVVSKSGDLEQALVLREAALAAVRAAGRPFAEADELHMIGEVLRDLGRLEEAADALLRAREIARKIGYDWLLAANAHSLGDLDLDRADRRRRCVGTTSRWTPESGGKIRSSNCCASLESRPRSQIWHATGTLRRSGAPRVQPRNCPDSRSQRRKGDATKTALVAWRAQTPGVQAGNSASTEP
jgi:predicted ATPase/DNA-binding SARP family transcriptional activator